MRLEPAAPRSQVKHSTTVLPSRSRSAGFWQSYLIRICTVFHEAINWNQTTELPGIQKGTSHFNLFCRTRVSSLPFGYFSCAFVVCWFFFSKSTFSKNSFRSIIRVSNSLDPDQAGQFVGPNLGPNCLQRSPEGKADDTSRQRVYPVRWIHIRIHINSLPASTVCW